MIIMLPTLMLFCLICLGGGIFNLFLSTMNQTWKDTYIHSFSPLSSCFGGSSFAPLAFLGQESYGYSFQEIIANWGSIAFLSPYLQLFANQPLASTPSRNYTVSDIAKLLQDAGLPLTAQIYNNNLKYQITTPPNVPTNCIFGTNVPTMDYVNFATSKWFNGPFTNVSVPGDGTCSHTSLNWCEMWASKQAQPLRTYAISNMTHGGVLVNTEAIRTLVKILLLAK